MEEVMFEKKERRTNPMFIIILLLATHLAKDSWGVDISNYDRDRAIWVARRCILDLWFSLGACVVAGVIQYFVGYPWIFSLVAFLICVRAFWILADRTGRFLPPVNPKYAGLYGSKLFQMLFSGGAAAGFTFGAILPPLSIFIGLPVLTFLMFIAGARVSAWCIVFIDPQSPAWEMIGGTPLPEISKE